LLGVDDLLSRTLVRPEGDPWQEIPLAYELIERQASTLLGQGWLVIVESTFTHVPLEGGPELHEDVLSQMIELAERGGAAWALCQIVATLDLALTRRDETKRLSPEVVAGTVQLHERLELPAGTLKLSAVEQTPEEAARTLAAHISASLNRPT
jgi:hypothetical protein